MEDLQNRSVRPHVRLCKRNDTSITTGKSWSLMSESAQLVQWITKTEHVIN
jgi:hypothetical protein